MSTSGEREERRLLDQHQGGPPRAQSVVSSTASSLARSKANELEIEKKIDELEEEIGRKELDCEQAKADLEFEETELSQLRGCEPQDLTAITHAERTIRIMRRDVTKLNGDLTFLRKRAEQKKKLLLKENELNQILLEEENDVASLRDFEGERNGGTRRNGDLENDQHTFSTPSALGYEPPSPPVGNQYQPIYPNLALENIPPIPPFNYLDQTQVNQHQPYQARMPAFGNGTPLVQSQPRPNQQLGNEAFHNSGNQPSNLTPTLRNPAPPSSTPHQTHPQTNQQQSSGVPYNSAAQPFPPQQSNGVVTVSELVTALQNLMPVQQQPMVVNVNQQQNKNLPNFDGRPQDWLIFKSEFLRIKSNDPGVNLSRIQEHLKGAAKEAVHHLLANPLNVDAIMRNLEKRFGNSKHIIQSLIENVQRSKTPDINKPETIVDFGVAVDALVTNIESYGLDQYLNNIQLIKELGDKLPANLHRDWFQYLTRSNQPENLKTFQPWIAAEMESAYQRLKPYSDPKEDKPKQNRHVGITSAQDTDSEPGKKKKLFCVNCDIESHHIRDCRKFAALPMEEKLKLVKDKKLCFGCLRSGHRTNDCRSKSKCEIDNCGRYHHAALHEQIKQAPSEKKLSTEDDSETPNTSTHLGHLNQDTGEDLLWYIPVKVRGPNGVRSCYAMFDNGAQLSLMDQTLAQEIGLSGEKKTLNIGVFNGKETKVESLKVNLEVCGDYSNAKFHPIKNVQTLGSLDLPAQTVDVDQLQRKYPSLRAAPLKSQDKAKPLLVIGSDHWRLGYPHEKVEQSSTSPAAIKTKLGWHLVGSGGRFVSSRKGFFHVSSAQEEDLNKIVKDFVCLDNFGVKELPSIRSKEDVRALKIIDKTTTSCEERWETGLVWRDPDRHVPEMKASINDTYMDDFLSAADTENDVKQLQQEVTFVNGQGGFPVVKWSSSDVNVLMEIPEDMRAIGDRTIASKSDIPMEKTLGLQWSAAKDAFTFNVNMARIPEQVQSGNRNPTKREIASFIMSLFDPLGFLTPFKLKRLTAMWIASFRKMMKLGNETVTLDDMKKADLMWCKQVQLDSFSEELKLIRCGMPVGKGNRLSNLYLILNPDGLLVVSSRIENAPNVSFSLKNPIILDPKHRYTRLLIRWFHARNAHQGQEAIINNLRRRYWIISCRTAVRSAIASCIECKLQRAKPIIPIMGVLPEGRMASNEPAFTHTGVDLFGPMEVTIGRRHEKRWGVLFTCFTTRAVYIDLVPSLSTSDLIDTLVRFNSRRGPAKHLWSDNGTNLRGADNEIKKCIQEWEQKTIQDSLFQRSTEWHFIAPASPHMGGSYERLIGVAKKILGKLLKSRAPKEYTLLTLLAEVEGIMNSRPLTVSSPDPKDFECITPNHLLKLKMDPGSFIPGDFKDGERTRKMWRQTQQLADEFWRRWKDEYLHTLAPRPKWNTPQQPIKEGDIIILLDDQAHRNNWKKGVITKTFPGKDLHVRVVEVKVPVLEEGGKVNFKYLRRHVVKVIPTGLNVNDKTASYGREKCLGVVADKY